jgi:hypothetical protein
MRLAGDAITHLSRGAWENFKKQSRVTKYFERSDRDKNQQHSSKSDKT